MLNFLKDFFQEMIGLFKSIAKYIRFIGVIILFLLSALWQLIPIYLFKIDINNITNDPTKAYLLLFSNIITLIIFILFFYKRLKKDFNDLKDMNRSKLKIALDSSIRFWLVGLVIMLVSNFIIKKMGISPPTNDENVKSILYASPIFGGISTMILAPFIEEVTFRLNFKDVIKNKTLFIILSGVIFGSIHILGSFNDVYQLLYLIPYCSVGISLSYIYAYNDNIYTSYIIHVFHNLLTAFTTFLLAGVILW